MVVPHLRCRSQCFEFMRVEVEVQPDREHAEHDDAAVEVAAHVFFCCATPVVAFLALALPSDARNYAELLPQPPLRLPLRRSAACGARSASHSLQLPGKSRRSAS